MIKRSLLFILFYVVGFYSSISYALEDNLMKSIEMIAKSNDFQSERVKIATENLANENTTSSVPGGEPYRRKIIIPENKYDRKLKANLTRVKKYSKDMSQLQLKYDPYHPAADKEGYVLMPNVDRNIERADIMDAKNAYDAGLNVIEMSRTMIQKTLETLK